MRVTLQVNVLILLERMTIEGGEDLLGKRINLLAALLTNQAALERLKRGADDPLETSAIYSYIRRDRRLS